MLSIYATKQNMGTWVNKVGKYLKQKLDGAYMIKFHPMECEVFLRLLMETEGIRDSFADVSFIISIVSYQNKLRINITEISEREKTIGQLILTEEQITNLEEVRGRVIKSINKFLEKEYPGFYLVY